MALNYTSDIMTLYDTKVGNDSNYETPGNFGLSAALSGVAGVDHVTVGTAGTYTSVPTATPSAGSATFSVRMKLLSGTTIAAAGTGYKPADVLSLSGGTKTTTAQVTVATVKLISATVAAGGTGYGNAQTFTVTVSGGTSTTTAQVSVTTSAGGVVTTINSVSRAGSYTALPTNPAATTGDNGTDHGTGLTLNLTWGINSITVPQAGIYSALPSNPISTTGGTGTGGTLTGSWGVVSVIVTAPGSYEPDAAPTITFGSGSAAATAVLATSTFGTHTQKMLMLIEIMRSYLAEADNTAQVKEIHEVLRKMLMTMKFGGKANFDASTLATNALDSAMHYFANNAKVSASGVGVRSGQ